MGISISSRGIAKGLTATLAALILSGGLASTASAGSIIFKDNFNRGHYGNSHKVGNYWKEDGRSYDDVAIKSNRLLLRDSQGRVHRNKGWKRGFHYHDDIDASATRWISTRGYENLYLKYSFKPTTYTKRFWGKTRTYNHNEYNDFLKVDFRVLGSKRWNPLAKHSLGKANIYRMTWNTESLGRYATNTKIQLRFWTDVTEPAYLYGGNRYYRYTSAGDYEGAYIDNVKVWGDPIKQPVATPEPSTMALFGSGLLGMGLWRARKNKKEQA